MDDFEQYIEHIYDKEGKKGVLEEYMAIVPEIKSCEEILSGGMPMIIKGFFIAKHYICAKKLSIIKIFALQHGFEIK